MNREVTGFDLLAAIGGIALFYTLAAAGAGEVNEPLALASLALVLVEPLLVLAHELGHAVAAVRLTRRRARIQIGDPPFALRFALGRIDVKYGARGYVAHCALDPSAVVTGRGLLLISLAGPAVDLAFAVALGAVAFRVDDPSSLVFWLLSLSAGIALLSAILNTIPMRGLPSWWPGAMSTEEDLSDGYLAREAIRAGLGTVVAAPAPRRVLGDAAGRALLAAASAACAERATMLEIDHLLVGLYAADGVAGRVLRESGYRAPTPPATVPPNQLELTPTVKRVLQRAKDMLTLRGDEYVDTEHLLLSLVEEPDGPAADSLTGCGVDRVQLRSRLLRALAG